MAFTKKFVFLAINFIFMTWIMFSTTDFALGSMGAKFKYVFRRCPADGMYWQCLRC